jgi:quercetin dioxygenase-like cupin family protein
MEKKMFKTSRNDTLEDPEIPTKPGWEGMHVWWLINHQHGGSQLAVVNVTEFPPNKSHEIHRHPHAEEFFYVLQGSGLHLTGEEQVRLNTGEIAFIPKNEWHGFTNDTNELTIAITIFAGVNSYQSAGYEIFSR